MSIRWRSWWVTGMALLLAACATHPPAPVVERSSRPPPSEIPVDGLYRVERGDTLYAIAFKYGLDHRDIARWNNIASPYTIYPDQALRLRSPPPSSVATTGVPARSSRTTSTTQGSESRSSTPSSGSRSSSSSPAAGATTAARSSTQQKTPESSTPAPRTPPASSSSGAGSSGGWAWPLEGPVLRSFKAGDPTRKGIDISGSEGAPVRAASGGEVVYSGNGLIGYGELVIVKHDDRMLSAYAHNRRRLVVEGERVSRGQEIAEVGRNDRSETVLHFEIRRDGKPIDPLQLLPSR